MVLKDLEDVVKKHMLLADPDIVKLLCSFVVAQRMEIAPPWLFIVGSSSGGKSMLLNSLRNVKGYFALDDLTANTFVSGQQKKGSAAGSNENSLLNKFKSYTFLTMKDFTTILGKDKESKGIVVSQLRKIYDGDFVKHYGNGVEEKWKGKIGLLCGVTTKIYTTWGQYSDMGERFLMYYFKQPDRKEVSRYLLSQNANINASDDMAKAFQDFIDGLIIPDEIPELDEKSKDDLIDLADLATLARSGVERNENSREKHIEFAHDPEMPMRFLRQLQSLAIGMMIVNGSSALTEADKRVLFRIALDSIPRQRKMVLDKLTEFEKMSEETMHQQLGFPIDTVRRWCQDLGALKILKRSRGYDGKIAWELHGQFRQTISRFENIEMTNEELIEAVEEPLDFSNAPVIKPDVQSGKELAQEMFK